LRRNKPQIRSSSSEEFDKMHLNHSKNCKESPDWFKFYNQEQLNKVNDKYINNGESLHILSKFKRWITVTPIKKDRNHPLEIVKLTSLQNSKIVPYWMQIKTTVEAKNLFKPIQINDIREGKNLTILVDKEQIKENNPYQ